MRTIILTLAWLLSVLGIQPAQARQWTDTEGREMEAEFVKVEAGMVTFKKTDGIHYAFPFAKLSKADQAYLKAAHHAPQQSTAPEAETTASNQLPETKLTAWLDKNLVERKGKRISRVRESRIPEAEYIALYFSASWCPPCRKFTPELVKFYNDHQYKHSNFEIILVSSDRDKDAMEDYLIDYEMPWPAIKHRNSKDPEVRNFTGGGIPCLVLIDREGTVIQHSYVDGTYQGPQIAMRKLDELLGD